MSWVYRRPLKKSLHSPRERILGKQKSWHDSILWWWLPQKASLIKHPQGAFQSMSNAFGMDWWEGYAYPAKTGCLPCRTIPSTWRWPLLFWQTHHNLLKDCLSFSRPLLQRVEHWVRLPKRHQVQHGGEKLTAIKTWNYSSIFGPMALRFYHPCPVANFAPCAKWLMACQNWPPRNPQSRTTQTWWFLWEHCTFHCLLFSSKRSKQRQSTVY